MTQRVEIFFNEAEHKYTDNFGNPYTSTTTVIGKYVEKFNFEERAEMCHRSGLKGNPKYRTSDGSRALTPKEIMFQWEKLKNAGCDRGNLRHNFLEDAIKTANNYNRTGANKFINDKIYTIPDIQENHEYGRINLDFFIKTGIAERYPIIFKVIEAFVNQGYSVYAEIGVYNYDFLISGLIDVLLVKDNDFIILDWKTNKDRISYESGYFEKDFEGNRTGKFVRTNDMFKHPLEHLPASVGYKYALQLSMYAYLVELFGFNCQRMMIAQILHEPYTEENLKDDLAANKYMPDTKHELIGKEAVAFYPVEFMKQPIATLCSHHTQTYNKNRNNQFSLFS